ncbi:MAG: UvrD-helicase domain-containing protein, partial [candidate division Zixibacteria bacterium]|nr:UvrD-helicase domain-containing protein [candidate division Zixibacteria bacterium]
MIAPNLAQQRAIEAPFDAPVRIVAGAGTGKTEVVSRRYVEMLSIGGLHPDEILVLTFSEQAAAEMRARIFRAVSDAGLRYNRMDLAGAPISTFHAFGSRLMRDHSLRAGVDPGLPFLTEADTVEIMNGAINAFLDGGYEEVYDFDPLDKEVYTWESGGPMAVAIALAAQLRNQAAEEADIAARNLYGSSDRRAVLEP